MPTLVAALILLFIDFVIVLLLAPLCPHRARFAVARDAQGNDLGPATARNPRMSSLVSIQKRMFFSGVTGTRWSWNRERVVVFRV